MDKTAQHDPDHRRCGCSVPSAPGAPGATQLQLRVVNNSTQFQDLCVFQRPVGLGAPEALALAWMTEPAWPTTSVPFRWTVAYDFVWGDTGALAPGTVFRANQTWPADPTTPDRQQVLLDYELGAFTFQQGSVTPHPQPGSLYIKELSTIPPDTAAVGIGMSGAATFVVPAMPNIELVFSPHPSYWVTAGTFETGQVIDVEEISNAAEVQFPAGVSSMVATLQADNTWTVAPDTA